MTPYLIFAAAYAFCLAATAAAFAVAGWWLRIPPKEIGLFHGPKIIGWESGGIIYRVNSIPLGSYVQFHEEPIQNASVWRKTPLTFAAVVVLLAIACLAMGLEGATLVGRQAPRIVLGAIQPGGQGAAWAGEALTFIRSESALAVLGGTAATLCAFNLLPMTGLPIGELLFSFLKLVAKVEDPIEPWVRLLSFCVTVAVALAWFYAFWVAMTG